jgi:hypothetical protein
LTGLVERDVEIDADEDPLIFELQVVDRADSVEHSHGEGGANLPTRNRSVKDRRALNSVAGTQFETLSATEPLIPLLSSEDREVPSGDHEARRVEARRSRWPKALHARNLATA